MRALGLMLVVLTATGCSTDRCKNNTVLLTVSLSNGAEVANFIDVQLAIDGGPSQAKTISHSPGSTRGSIEVDFAMYPSGRSLALTVIAREDDQIVASTSQTAAAMPGCTGLSFALDGGSSASDLAITDGSADDMASADMPMPPDMATTPDMAFLPGNLPSCSGLAASCGASLNDSCCASPVVTGGTFYRSYDVATDNAYPSQSYPATVSDFRLDKYDVTVGRFRKFVNAGMGTQVGPPGLGSGANPYIANSGWDSNFNANLTANTAALIAAVKCNATHQTWTDTVGANENEPMGCITWFEAFAFCAWDAGFLPTEAEWNYAASGGNEQRAFPWSNPPASLTIDCSYANYLINNPSGTYCVNGTTGAMNAVGSESPKGDGKWGQSDLAGNVYEWMLDWNATYSNPCTDCANLTAASGRVIRSGAFSDVVYSAGTSELRSASRDQDPPGNRYYDLGFRCARKK